MTSGAGTTLKLWPVGGSVEYLGASNIWVYPRLRQAYNVDAWLN